VKVLQPASAVRSMLLGIGKRVPAKRLASLRSALGYLELGALVESLRSDGPLAECTDRFGVFAEAVRIVGGRSPLYLEFGVFEGETIRWWSENLRAPDAHLVGFDSFEGLPEEWRPGFDVGAFRTEGPPSIQDPRVTFVAGWFDETVPMFRPPDHDQLIVNVDSDLYSSARTVLEWAGPRLVPGSLLYFDELTDRDHELRALQEFLSASEIDLCPRAYSFGGRHFLFEVR
jgi:hypothetical protein